MSAAADAGARREDAFLPVQILVVDDDAHSRRAMVRVLEHHGYSVIEASSGEAAMALLAQTHVPVDLLLTDMQMPGLSGAELVAQVRAAWPDIPVLYVSGDESFAKLAADGPPATRFLRKPFVPADLALAVEQIVLELELEA